MTEGYSNHHSKDYPVSNNWSYDEILVVCAELIANDWNEIRATSDSALELSLLLRDSSKIPLAMRDENFRSPSSVQRKSADIRTLRPGYAGAPTKGGKTTRQVVEQFVSNPSAMTTLAQHVRDKMMTLAAAAHGGPDESQPAYTALEGSIIERVCLIRERSKGLRAAKIDHTLKMGHSLKCEVCNFDFHDSYGEIGRGYIEVHHTVPLHASGAVQNTLDDLTLLCGNCHRMIHRRAPWLTPEQLRSAARKRG